MKKLKRIIRPVMEEEVPWDINYDFINLPIPVTVPSVGQTNTLSTYCLAIKSSSSDASQQTRFVYYNQNGTTIQAPWTLIYSNNLVSDLRESNISPQLYFTNYLENDIVMEFRNTAGSVYMNPFTITGGGARTLPSIALQSYCASFICGPIDMAGFVVTPPYNGTKPGSYSAQVGIATQQTLVPQIQDSVASFIMNFTNIFFSGQPSATWKFQVYRSNTQTALTLVNSGDIVLNQDTGVLGVYLMKFITNYSYTLRILCFSSGTQVTSPFPDLNITSFMGQSFNASRISGDRGNAPQIDSIPSGFASAQFTITSTYISPFDVIPINDSSLSNYIELKIVVTMSNQPTSLSEGITIWYNFESETGYWPLCINKFISNQQEIFLRTGGRNSTGTYFNENYLSNLVSVQTPLFINIMTFELNKGAYNSEEYTSGRFTTSFGPLINLAKQSPSSWVSNSNYICVPQKTRYASASTLYIQFFAKYTSSSTNIKIGDIVDLVRNEEIDEGEHIYEKEQKRILNQRYTPEEIPVDDWLLPPINPKEQLDRPIFSKKFKIAPHDPAQIELIERGKSELVNVLRANPTWRVGTIGEFINEFHKISNPKLRVEYPALNNPQLLAAIANYYGTDSRLADLYQPPAFMYNQSPYWESIPTQLKWSGDKYTSFLRELKHSVFGTHKRSALDLEIQKAKLMRGPVNPNSLDYQPFTKLSEPAFNYYWFGLPYNVYNRSQMDMLQSVLEHDKPAVYDKAKSVVPIETDMYGYIMEMISNEMNDPFNALALTGVITADKYRMYQKNRNKSSTEIMAETSKQIARAGTTKGAAQDIAEVAAGVLTTKLAAQVLKTVATPFTQESATALDYFLTLVHNYGPPILPVYQKKKRNQARNYLDSMMNTLTQQIKNKDLRQLGDNSSLNLKALPDQSPSPLVILNQSANNTYPTSLNQLINSSELNNLSNLAGIPYINAANATDFVNKLEQINTQIYDDLTWGEEVDINDEPEEINTEYYEYSSPYNDIIGPYETEEAYLEDMRQASRTVNRLYKNWARYNEFIQPSSNESREYFGATPSNIPPFDLQYAVQTLIQQDKLENEAEIFQFYRKLGYQPIKHTKKKAYEILRQAQARSKAQKELNEPMSGFLKFASTEGSPYDPIPGLVNRAKKYLQDREIRISQQEPMTGFLRFGPSTFNPFGKYYANDAKIRQFQEALKNKSAPIPTPTQAQLNTTAKKIANQTIPIAAVVQQEAVKGGINVKEYKKIIQAIETAQNTMRNVSPAVLLGAALKIAQKEITNAVKGGQFAEQLQWGKAEEVIKNTEEVYKNVTKPVEQQAPGMWDTLKGYFFSTATPDNVKTAAKVAAGAAAAGAAYAAYNYATSPPQNTTEDIPDPLPAHKMIGFLGKAQKEKLQKVYNTQVMLTLAKTSNSQVALSLLNSDLARTDAGRQKQIHAFSELFANLNKNEMTFAPKQKNLIFEAFANKFRQNAVQQALKRNMKAFFHYKTLASILKPEDPAEEQIKDLVESYYVGPKIYDSRQSITEQSQNHLDHVESIALNANVLHEFIERTIKGPVNQYKRTFNDAFVFDQQRPNYDYNDVVKLKPPKDDFFKKRETKADKLRKRLHEEIKKEEQKISKDTIRDMLKKANTAKGTRHEMMKLSDMLSMRAHNNVDLGYVKTVLFPELYNSDIPQPMSTQSYCRFTDKREITLSSFAGTPASPTQNALLLWYPKTANGPQLFIRYGDIDAAKVLNFQGATALGPTDWRWAASMAAADNFTQLTLVSASLSIQYIGQLQLEQGYMVASQLYGISPNNLTTDDVENGQFRTMCKPGDGLRSIYLPKDMQDFVYYPCSSPSADGQSTVMMKNSGYRQYSDYINIDATAQQKPPSTTGYAGIGTTTWPSLKNTSSGTLLTSFQLATDGDAIAIYWKGLSTAALNDIRIDIVRKFNAFPTSKQRDILDLTKPKKLFDPKKTIDVITELQSAIPQLCTHSLKQMDRVSDQIQEFIPNIGHLYDEGMLKEGTSLEGFAEQLQGIAGNEGGMTNFPGTIY